MQTVSLYITLLLLAISAYTDMKYMKIYNWLTFPTIVMGLVLSVSPSKAVFKLVWILVFFILYNFHILGGGGDIKLIMAVTALRGIYETYIMIFAGAVCMIIFCFLSDREESIASWKGIYNSAKYKTNMLYKSEKKYPFAPFLLMGYCFNFFV